MKNINIFNFLTYNKDRKEYEPASPMVIDGSIVWDSKTSEALSKKFVEESKNMTISNPCSISHLTVDGWNIECDEHANVSMLKKILIDESFKENDNKTTLSSTISLPLNFLKGDNSEIIQCTNGTTDEILQHCLISATPIVEGTFINSIKLNLFKATSVDVANGFINIFDDDELRIGSRTDQYIYVLIKGKVSL